MDNLTLPEKYLDSPAECEAWDNVVVSTYRLVQRNFECDGVRIKFFSKDYRERKGGHFSTAPYLTDGGITTASGITRPCVDKLIAFRNSLNADYLLIRTRENIFRDFQDVFHIDPSYLTFMLDLSHGSDYIWEKCLKSETRNRTRKGLKSGPEVRVGQGELLEDFYRVITRGWRDLGTPTHGKRFYANILRFFGDKARIIVLYLDGKPVSTSVILVCNNTLHHPYVCTIRKYNPLSINNVLYWNIITWACEHGLKWFDLGRSRHDQGTAVFKKTWGAQPVQVYYNYLLGPNRRPPNYDSKFVHFATTLWKRLPVPIANLLGPRLISGVL